MFRRERLTNGSQRAGSKNALYVRNGRLEVALKRREYRYRDAAEHDGDTRGRNFLLRLQSERDPRALSIVREGEYIRKGFPPVVPATSHGRE